MLITVQFGILKTNFSYSLIWLSGKTNVNKNLIW